MDREQLARRNIALVEALHQPTPKHRARDRFLQLAAKAPVARQSAISNRVLIIRPDHLGDMLLTTPAIQAIKARRPELELHVLCGPWCADLLANYDEVDQALTLPFPGFRRDSAGGNAYLLALGSARKLRAIGYDSAIVMRPDHWWGAMLAWLAGIPQRVGYDLPGVAPFLTLARKLEHQHAAAQNLRLVEALMDEPLSAEIRLDFPLQAEDRKRIDARLAEWGIGEGAPIICIHPGSGAPSKLWLAEKWAAVADAAAEEFEAAIIFTGTAGEAAIIDEIAVKMNTAAHIIAGSTSVGQLAALYSRSLAVVGPDSGAMHLAAAVHRPTVALFGPADPLEFAPWGDSKRHAVLSSPIACRPCRILDWRGDDPDYHPCVRDISVAQVLHAARRVVGRV